MLSHRNDQRKRRTRIEEKSLRSFGLDPHFTLADSLAVARLSALTSVTELKLHVDLDDLKLQWKQQRELMQPEVLEHSGCTRRGLGSQLPCASSNTQAARAGRPTPRLLLCGF